MPIEPVERQKAFVDLLGQHLFSLRNQRLEAIRRLVESPEARERLGTIHRRPFEGAGILEPEGQQAALDLAQAGVDQFLQDLLGLLQNIGDDVRLGDDHSLRYRLHLEVVCLKDAESPVVAEELINLGNHRALQSEFGRWRNAYGSPR
ncbi:hypothetical protein ACYOEI_03155 [Singulisphaera rosea]